MIQKNLKVGISKKGLFQLVKYGKIILKATDGYVINLNVKKGGKLPIRKLKKRRREYYHKHKFDITD